MNENGVNISKALETIKQQQQVIGEIHDMLHVGTFPGHLSQKLVMAQAYMKGIYNQVSAEIRKLEEQLGEEMKPAFTEALKEQSKA